MRIINGLFDIKSRSICMTFIHKGVTHYRTVSVCLDNDGACDWSATDSRVAEIARDVANDINLGVITNTTATDNLAELMHTIKDHMDGRAIHMAGGE